MNNNYKEIVTKAVIGKSRKSSKDDYNILIEGNISNVLGCWVINHSYKGYNSNGKVAVNGSYDVNIWYSYDNNTKTNVIARTFNYSDLINVNLKEKMNENNEIIVRCLTSPNASDVKIDGNNLKLTIEKELAVEIVGDVKVKVNVYDDYDDYEEDISNEDIEINEDYLNSAK